QKHSMFLVPHNYTHQFSNMQGDKPVRLLHYNYMPLTLSGVRDVNFIFGNLYEGADIQNEMDFYSEAKMISQNMWTTHGGAEPIGTGIFFQTCAHGTNWTTTRGVGPGEEAFTFSSPTRKCLAICPFSTRGYTRKPTATAPGASSSYRSARDTRLCGKKGKKKSLFPGMKRAVSCRPTSGFTSISTLAANQRDISRCSRPCSSTAMRKKSKTAPKIRSNTSTKIPGCARSLRVSWQSED